MIYISYAKNNAREPAYDECKYIKHNSFTYVNTIRLATN